ncbi:Homeobox protein Mohawk [Frankliniella fusca]|uniref:Homeobox protein Mohawk n=1 Tax=Frankliniella fusca TaxID=407009 RepID=A0AAE1HDW9_9NEOP|nr:Homeobox protein Mohawk [Frankliniella fusca]
MSVKRSGARLRAPPRYCSPPSNSALRKNGVGHPPDGGAEAATPRPLRPRGALQQPPSPPPESEELAHTAGWRLRSRRHRLSTRPVKRPFTPDIKKLLKGWLVRRRDNPYPSRAEKEALATRTGLTYMQVCNWFANWRRKLRDCARPEDGDEDEDESGRSSGEGPGTGSWAHLIRRYNAIAGAPNSSTAQEHFSISSSDSIWQADGDARSDTEANFALQLKGWRENMENFCGSKPPEGGCGSRQAQGFYPLWQPTASVFHGNRRFADCDPIAQFDRFDPRTTIGLPLEVRAVSRALDFLIPVSEALPQRGTCLGSAEAQQNAYVSSTTTDRTDAEDRSDVTLSAASPAPCASRKRRHPSEDADGESAASWPAVLGEAKRSKGKEEELGCAVGTGAGAPSGSALLLSKWLESAARYQPSSAAPGAPGWGIASAAVEHALEGRHREELDAAEALAFLSSLHFR